MKIVQFMASEQWGGAEKVFIELSNELAIKHQVYAILLRNTEYKELFSDKVQIIELKSHPTSRNPFLIFEIRSIIRRLKAQVVHTHAAKASELVRLAFLIGNINHIATKHNSRKGRIFNSLPCVTAVSKEVCSTIRNGKKVEVIYNGLTPQKAVLSDKPEKFSIVAVGRLDESKGFDLLIQEVANLQFEFDLFIIGEGKERAALEQLIKDLELSESVKLLGHRNDIPELLKMAHLQLISSRNEGFSLVAAEGLFHSDVLVSTKVGIAAEILPQELLVEGDTIGKKINDVHERYEDYVEVFEKVKESYQDSFNLSNIADDYIAFYRQTLSKQPE